MMGLEIGAKGKQQTVVHYMNAPTSCVVEENFGGYFHDHDDFALAEVLQDQEIVYESFQRNGQSNRAHRPAASNANLQSGRPNPGQSSGQRSASRSVNYELQVAADEAIAWELQELENQLVDLSFDDASTMDNRRTSRAPPVQPISNSRNTTARTSSQATREDGIDPDNMTYEELQQLGEAIGTQSRGLSEEMISLLPASTYKTGLFSRKERHDECVICCMVYKNRDKLITLPCEHKYHKDCVTKWLKINKTCPVCGKEVFGS